MKINDTLSGLALLALSLLILYTVSSYPVIPGQNIGPGAFPGLLAGLQAAVITMVKDPGCKAPVLILRHYNIPTFPLLFFGRWNNALMAPVFNTQPTWGLPGQMWALYPIR